MADDKEKGLNAFLENSDFSFSPNQDQNTDNSEDGQRPSRVLSFIKSPEEYYDWFRYILETQYGKPETNAALGIGGSKIMMDSSYIMGSRLMVKHASMGPVGGSHFAQIYDDQRKETNSYVSFDDIIDEHVNQVAFTDFRD